MAVSTEEAGAVSGGGLLLGELLEVDVDVWVVDKGEMEEAASVVDVPVVVGVGTVGVGSVTSSEVVVTGGGGGGLDVVGSCEVVGSVVVIGGTSDVEVGSSTDQAS